MEGPPFHCHRQGGIRPRERRAPGSRSGAGSGGRRGSVVAVFLVEGRQAWSSRQGDRRLAQADGLPVVLAVNNRIPGCPGGVNGVLGAWTGRADWRIGGARTGRGDLLDEIVDRLPRRTP